MKEPIFYTQKGKMKTKRYKVKDDDEVVDDDEKKIFKKKPHTWCIVAERSQVGCRQNIVQQQQQQ